MQRIDELETRLAQQDYSLAELSNEVYRQQRQIAELEVKVRYLSERLQAVAAPETAASSADEAPPHY